MSIWWFFVCVCFLCGSQMNYFHSSEWRKLTNYKSKWRRLKTRANAFYNKNQLFALVKGRKKKKRCADEANNRNKKEKKTFRFGRSEKNRFLFIFLSTLCSHRNLFSLLVSSSSCCLLRTCATLFLFSIEFQFVFFFKIEFEIASNIDRIKVFLETKRARKEKEKKTVFRLKSIKMKLQHLFRFLSRNQISFPCPK